MLKLLQSFVNRYRGIMKHAQYCRAAEYDQQGIERAKHAADWSKEMFRAILHASLFGLVKAGIL
jgi:hypothetical protein